MPAMSHVWQFGFTIVTGFLQIKRLSRPLPQIVLCFAGERVFPEGCSREHPPSDHQPLSPAAPHQHLMLPRVPPPLHPALCPHLGQRQQRAGCLPTCPVTNCPPYHSRCAHCSQRVHGAGSAGALGIPFNQPTLDFQPSDCVWSQGRYPRPCVGKTFNISTQQGF